VPATPLLAVNTPRSDYADTIPDASEFLLNMKVLIPGSALEQDYRLRARLLAATELVEWRPLLEPAGLERGVVAKVVSCEPVAGCPPTAIDDITRSQKCTFVPPLKLVKLIPPKPRAVSPDAFQPPQ
jgi:hypothetical protein